MLPIAVAVAYGVTKLALARQISRNFHCPLLSQSMEPLPLKDPWDFHLPPQSHHQP